MKILFTAIGTRGDVEPFLALARLCRSRGDEVVGAFPAQLCGLAEDAGVTCRPLTPEFLELLDSPEGRMAIGGKGSPFAKMLSLIRLYRMSTAVGRTLVNELCAIVDEERPDRVVHHPKATYPMLLEAKHPGTTVMVCPVPYTVYATTDRPHIGFPFNGGSTLNRLSYRLAHKGLMSSLKSTSREALTRDGVSITQVDAASRTRATVFTVSPSLFPRPAEWPAHAQVLGFRSREAGAPGALPPGLDDFLGAHERVLLISFGSMVGPEPERTTHAIVNVLTDLGVPAVINTSGGGLVAPPGLDRRQFFVTESVSYDAVMPHVAAAMHHGGSGTTHQSLRHGLPTLVIPHVIDQFVWAEIVEARGAGPKGLPVAKLTPQALRPRIEDLMSKASYRERARALAAAMAREDFDDEVVAMIHRPRGAP